MDLEKYFARIGYGGGTQATVETIDALAHAHVCAIPFENLDVLLGREVRVDGEGIWDKIVVGRRGGYCFEQNALFLAVLTELGFAARPISARVRWGRARDYTPARTHMFVEVMIGGEARLADVGVGGMSLTSTLRRDAVGRQDTPHEPRRLVRDAAAGVTYHQVWIDGEWRDVCEFTGESMPEIDRVVGNWYTSTHPGSHFRSRLQAARAAEGGGRVTLLNRQLTVRGGDGAIAERIEWQSGEELLGILDRWFGLTFPAGTIIGWTGMD